MPKRVDKIQIGDRLISRDNYYKHQHYNPVTGCTEWTGVKSNIGYGFIGFSNVNDKTKTGMMTVHRVALALKLGRPVDPDLNANHSCHNKLCVTQDHLSEGTQQQKRADMVRDGLKAVQGPRGNYAKQSNRKYKYTEDEIKWIRDATTDKIVAKYNITKRQASTLRHGLRTNYKWLPWAKK
jgi:hypothetical protein